jgi:Domain of unknown function (DUF4390)
MPRLFSSSRREPVRVHAGVWPGLIVLFGALLSALAGGLAFANALDGVLKVDTAYVNFDHGVIQLFARVRYPLNPAIREALQDGVTLTFDVEVKVDRERRFWFDANVVDLTLRRELAYRVVTDRFVVRDVDGSHQKSFGTLQQALAYLGKVDGWPILVEPQLDGGRYIISVRAGVRRGKLPSSLRALLFWTDDWQRVSKWYSWSLPV